MKDVRILYLHEKMDNLVCNRLWLVRKLLLEGDAWIVEKKKTRTFNRENNWRE